ncbi:hypothetical protein LAV73_06720 [Lysinibacillus xylanilyticus]|uniref:hypothetical protein n=1 Tax=Lysinibacillus xylanilyticus TaxID=582475 RepID=UPI002B244672|nr:hypothetical protein [Lysinibacillus xylanilyticus]MEB2279693.1 hypothetical protein [Lysinibacillus xylanilyticus]
MLDTLMKHAKHFTNLEHEKDVCHVVHIDSDGNVFMTNAISAVLVKNVCPDDPNRTITLDNKPSKVPVYEYSKFFTSAITETLELDVKEMLLLTQALEAVKKVEGESPQGAFRFETVDDQYKIFYQGIEFTSTYHLLDKQPNQTEVNIHFDVSLLTKTFKLLKDLGLQNCNMQFIGKHRPCYFSSDDESVRVVVLPCRTY